MPVDSSIQPVEFLPRTSTAHGGFASLVVPCVYPTYMTYYMSSYLTTAGCESLGKYVGRYVGTYIRHKGQSRYNACSTCWLYVGACAKFPLPGGCRATQAADRRESLGGSTSPRSSSVMLCPIGPQTSYWRWREGGEYATTTGLVQEVLTS